MKTKFINRLKDNVMSTYLADGVDKIFIDVPMGGWESTPANAGHHLGTTGLGPCISIIFFIKSTNSQRVEPQDCIVFTHFDSVSSCEAVDFEEITKIEIVGQTRTLLNSIIDNMKKYLARRGQKLEKISNIVLLGGSKDPINQSILEGIEQLLKSQENQNDEIIRDFIQKISFFKLALYTPTLDGDDRTSAGCNVFAEITAENVKQVHVEYEVNKDHPNFGYLNIPLVSYQINVSTNCVQEEIYNENINQLSQAPFNREDLTYLKSVFDGVTEAFSQQQLPPEYNLERNQGNLVAARQTICSPQITTSTPSLITEQEQDEASSPIGQSKNSSAFFPSTPSDNVAGSSFPKRKQDSDKRAETEKRSKPP
jgi:hypothetical protein